MAIYHIGTCSWTEKTLIEDGSFYPPQLKNPAERLNFYAQHFNTVEVDSTFMLSLQRNAHLGRATFIFPFNIKSFSLFTFHKTSYLSFLNFEKNCPKGCKNDLTSIYRKSEEWLKIALSAFLSAINPCRKKINGLYSLSISSWIEKVRNYGYLSGLENIKGT